MADKANAVNWFEIPVTNLDRAKTFYEKVFNVELTRVDMPKMQMLWFPMEQGAPGSMGTLIKAETYVPSYQGSLVYFSVDDIETTLERVNKNGGKTLNPKMSIGEYGFVGHFEDCEGNRVALHSVN
jgi:hypothetical protein